MTISEYNRNKAYIEHSFKHTQCGMIMQILINNPKGLSIGQIALLTGLPKSTISGRIGDLKPNVKECGSVLDQTTNKQVTLWRYNPQSEMFTIKKLSLKQKLRMIEDLCRVDDSELSRDIKEILIM